MSSSDPHPSAEARAKKEPTKGEQIYDAWLTPTDTRYLPDMINEAIEEAREKALAWADAEVTATRASEARMLRRLEEANAAGREREREALERAAKAMCWACEKGWPVAKNPTREFSRWWGPVYPMFSHVVPASNEPFIGIDCQCDATPIRAALGDRPVDRAEAGMGKTDFEKDGGAF